MVQSILYDPIKIHKRDLFECGINYMAFSRAARQGMANPNPIGRHMTRVR